MPTMIQDVEQVITEDTILLPIESVFEEINGRSPRKIHKSLGNQTTKTIQDLFPEQIYEDKDIQKAKEILGKLADEFTNAELRDLVAQVKYLAESWLDDFERGIFKGIILKELLHERSI